MKIFFYLMILAVNITFFNCQISNAALVGFWQFDEGGGTVASDSSGNNNHGTISGPTWSSNGGCINALHFDGADDYVEVQDNPVFHTGGVFTIEAWIFPEPNGDSVRTIITKGEDVTTDNIYFSFYLLSDNRLCLALENQSEVNYNYFSNGSVQNYEWQHVAATRNSSGVLKIFINSIEDASFNSILPSPNCSQTVTIGVIRGANGPAQNPQPLNNYFKGLIDEVRFYNTELSDNEIMLDMQSCSPGNLNCTDMDGDAYAIEGGDCGIIDNCPTMPNGPLGGTCTAGDFCKVTPCGSDIDCGVGGFCSKNQEDSDGDGMGDACEFCEANFDCDLDVDGADASLFKQYFGRSKFQNPCTNISSCKGDFDCDHDVDGTDASLFKSDFGRSQFYNVCPSCEICPWCLYP